MRSAAFCVVTLVLLISGCVTTYSPYSTKNYKIDEPKVATVGSTMVEWSYGTRNDQTGAKEGLKKELIYCGKANNVLQIKYREYDEGTAYIVARSPFYLDLKYDIFPKSTVSFQDFEIRIDSADQNSIVFAVVNAPSYPASADNSGKVGLFFDAGGTVIKVAPDMPAQKAGILVGDRISEIDARPIPVRDHDGIFQMLSGRPGSEVTIRLVRGDQTLTFKLLRSK